MPVKIKFDQQLREALAIVYDLAYENALDPQKCDPELKEEAQKQQDALALILNLF